MNTLELMKKTLLAGMVVAAFGLAACQADGNGDSNAGNGNGPVTDDGGTPGDTTDDNGGLGPNDGSTATTVGEDTNGDGTISSDETTDGTKGFVCEKVATDIATGVKTEVGTGGLVGGPLTALLKLLGGDPVTTLTNSVTEPNNVIDGKLATYATFNTAAGGLGALNSVELNVIYPSSTGMKGTYAVFGLTFPAGTVDLSLANNIKVSTYKGTDTTPVETLTLTQSGLDLLGASVAGGDPAWFGIKTTKDYDRVTLSLASAILSVSVGEILHAHELCTGGKLVTPPATTP